MDDSKQVLTQLSVEVTALCLEHLTDLLANEARSNLALAESGATDPKVQIDVNKALRLN